jgi:hypothetical protein
MSPSSATSHAHNRHTLLLVSGLATLAGVAAILADLALEYTPDSGALFSPTYQYLVDIPEWRLLVGHYLGIAAITLEISGFWVVYQLARAAGVRSALPVLLAFAYCTVFGVVFHGSIALLALLVQAQRGAPPDAAPLFASAVGRVGAFIRPLAALALLSLAGWSAWYGWVVARGRTALPRGLTLCNPLLVLLVCRVIAAIFPPAALVLAPTALNVSTTATFLALTLALGTGARNLAEARRLPAARLFAE